MTSPFPGSSRPTRGFVWAGENSSPQSVHLARARVPKEVQALLVTGAGLCPATGAAGLQVCVTSVTSIPSSGPVSPLATVRGGPDGLLGPSVEANHLTPLCLSFLTCGMFMGTVPLGPPPTPAIRGDQTGPSPTLRGRDGSETSPVRLWKALCDFFFPPAPSPSPIPFR